MKNRVTSQPTAFSMISLTPNKIGGVEAYARELSRQLGEYGWRSVLCFLSPPPAKVREYFDLPNVTVESLDSQASGLAYQLRLVRLLARYRPRIFHLHLSSVFGSYAWLARIFGVKKIYFTDHASRPEGFIAKVRPWWKRLLFRTVMAPLTRVFCISNYVQESFIDLGLWPREKTSVIYNGVDIDRVVKGKERAKLFRKSMGISAESFLVVQVGQIIPEKGLPDLLEAAVLVCKVDSTVHFLIVGDGPHLQEYRERIKHTGLADRVLFSGPVIDPLAAGVFAAADLVCQVSRWQEGFGLVIAEAMAAAKPVLATRCGGIPELVTDNITGYTVEIGDVEAMSSRILELAEDRNRVAAFGAAGQKICREKFDHRKNVSQLLGIYGIH